MEGSDTTTAAAKGAGLVLLTLAAGQFLMTLDSSVMNVSIATVAKDVGTTVTGIQTAITLYTLVMAMLMITGGKIGSMIGRKRAFAIGCVIYGAGSLTTALAPNLTVLIFGWSFLEGIGAALILPAIVALVAGNFPAAERPRAYGLVMAAGAIAVAVGPLIGGLATTYASWRWVFAGEVVVVLVILLLARRIQDAPAEAPAAARPASARSCRRPGSAWPSSACCGRASGAGSCRSPTARRSLGLSPDGLADPRPGCSCSGCSSSGSSALANARRASRWSDRDVAATAQLTGGLIMFFFQFLIQAGLFFTIPLYLSVALGLSAIDTGSADHAAVDHPARWPPSASRGSCPSASPRRVVAARACWPCSPAS